MAKSLTGRLEELAQLKNRKGREKIVMLTAYDYQIAKILDEVGIDLILVGDSLAMVVQGCKNTKDVTMEEMIYHTRAVAKGAKRTPIVCDMPINSYETVENALRNARRFLHVGAHAVKVEGNRPEIITKLVSEGVPVMGHVGLLPQTAMVYKVTGKQAEEAERILQDALEIDRAGTFGIVLESMPPTLAKKITTTVTAPTIGIGAGKYCDGQILVINDILGMDPTFSPKFVKQYANLNQSIKRAVTSFKVEVRLGKYPDFRHTYH